MRKILFVMPGQEDLGASLIAAGGFDNGEFEMRRFPDGETYVRVPA